MKVPFIVMRLNLNLPFVSLHPAKCCELAVAVGNFTPPPPICFTPTVTCPNPLYLPLWNLLGREDMQKLFLSLFYAIFWLLFKLILSIKLSVSSSRRNLLSPRKYKIKSDWPKIPRLIVSRYGILRVKLTEVGSMGIPLFGSLLKYSEKCLNFAWNTITFSGWSFDGDLTW